MLHKKYITPTNTAKLHSKNIYFFNSDITFISMSPRLYECWMDGSNFHIHPDSLNTNNIFESSSKKKNEVGAVFISTDYFSLHWKWNQSWWAEGWNKTRSCLESGPQAGGNDNFTWKGDPVFCEVICPWACNQNCCPLAVYSIWMNLVCPQSDAETNVLEIREASRLKRSLWRCKRCLRQIVESLSRGRDASIAAESKGERPARAVSGFPPHRGTCTPTSFIFRHQSTAAAASLLQQSS